ncbi:protein-glutamate O-methyltransferase CheR [soil metagenome]
MQLTQENYEPFLEHIQKKYGYDFSGYARSSFLRRLNRFMNMFNIDNTETLFSMLLEDEKIFSRFLEEITVNVTEMFRDPLFYRSLREKVVPDLKTYPYVRVWDAGCSTGEETYSLAFLLQEEDLHSRCRIYATDINQKVLNTAAEGIYNVKDMARNTQNYHLTGGKYDFSNYYHAKYNRVIMNDQLKKNIVFSVHNLATNGCFNEFNLIVCRNVMIYFNKVLQEKVFKIFFESLPVFGYLALDTKESMALSKYGQYFEVVDNTQKIYRKIKE